CHRVHGHSVFALAAIGSRRSDRKEWADRSVGHRIPAAASAPTTASTPARRLRLPEVGTEGGTPADAIMGGYYDRASPGCRRGSPKASWNGQKGRVHQRLFRHSSFGTR